MTQGTDSYQVWEDGASPICFASLSSSPESFDTDEFVRKILSISYTVSLRQRHRVCYIIINLSSLPRTSSGLSFVKALRKILAKTTIKAVAIIGYHEMNFKVNLQECEGGPKMKWFTLFEEALGFVNKQIEVEF
ncbi:hypothetical protein WSM22_44370 [Cytophagales bacterium WSM2-2]|nr:hypothetical protein WSM22_44370 [Cytophagales bacterium WSM2-2]